MARTFGLLYVLTGGLITLDSANDITSLLIAGLLHLVTSPVGRNLLAPRPERPQNSDRDGGRANGRRERR